jgi:hypothetical protein
MMPTIRNSRVAGIALALVVLVSGVAGAHPQEGFVLIANRANPVTALDREEVSKLFLLKHSQWPTGQRVQPVDQVESSPVRRRFSTAIIGMDVPSVKSFWQEYVFSGKGEPPPERATDRGRDRVRGLAPERGWICQRRSAR